VLRNVARSRERLPTPRQLAWLITQASTTYTEQERALLETLRGGSGFGEAYSLGQCFVQMIRKHTVNLYDEWLTDCTNSSLRTLQTFADTLKQDSAAVRAALTEQWSSGQVEGQVTRVKMVKRQMYGRASFHLLRQRVLGPP
jgi:transposase